MNCQSCPFDEECRAAQGCFYQSAPGSESPLVGCAKGWQCDCENVKECGNAFPLFNTREQREEYDRNIQAEIQRAEERGGLGP